MTRFFLDQQSGLARSVPLFRYAPDRVRFTWKDWNPALVRCAADLPQYLILGVLDASTFQLSASGWSARWQGTEGTTHFDVEYQADAGRWEIRQAWCGLDGGLTSVRTHVPLDRVIGQGVYHEFPSTWDIEAKSQLEAAYQVTVIEQQQNAYGFCGIPDGAFRTIVFPIAVSNLRPVRQWIQDLVDESPLAYPVNIEAKTVFQAVNYLEGKAVDWTTQAAEVFHQSVLETGLSPQGFPVREVADDGSAAWTLRREIYFLFIGLPFAGLTDFFKRMASANGPIRTSADPALRFELRPIVIPAAFELQAESLTLFDKGRTTRSYLLFAKPGEAKVVPSVEDFLEDELRAQITLAKVEAISNGVVTELEQIFEQATSAGYARESSDWKCVVPSARRTEAPTALDDCSEEPPMSDDIDLQFRPKTYFRPERLEQYLISKVKGAVLRKKLKALFKEGRREELRDLIDDVAFSDADRKVLESVHPMFMGGNYLPDTDEGEVEIARISIQSTTGDVTSVYARPENGVIHYRVVDEYGGDTLQGRSTATTTAPMTLGEFADFFFTAWPLIELLEMNFEDDLEGALGFFSVDSEFYPEFGSLCNQRVLEHFPSTDVDHPEAGDECPFCAHFNSPPAEDICEHAVAWVWDGQLEALGDGKVFESALRDLAEVVESAQDGSAIRAMLQVQARRDLTREGLIDFACLPFEYALRALADSKDAGGWATAGQLGGAGRTICVEYDSDLDRLASECRAILAACAFKIQTNDDAGSSLEDRRPEAPVQWQLVASGFWYQDTYHFGHIAYYIANPQPGCWVMESSVRNAILDDVTEEDVEEGRLNDDQIQAMWDQTLEEAQSVDHRRIVAWTEGIAPDLNAQDMAAVLYGAVCESGGREINERDDDEGLLDV